MVSLLDWPYQQKAGLGGSAAWAILNGKNGIEIEEELKSGVGWQDPAICNETGLCIWKSGRKPVLYAKFNPAMLQDKMALYWTGKEHVTKDLVSRFRDYTNIKTSNASQEWLNKLL